MGNKDLMLLRDITLRMDLGSFLRLNSSFRFLIVLVFVHRRIRSLSLEVALVQVSAHSLSKLMSWTNNGNLYQLCQKEEISEIKYVMLKDTLMLWVDLTQKQKSLPIQKRNGLKFLAILLVTILILGQAACYSLQNFSQINKQATKKA